jgi:deazaflavin-dependent oxidoreductase (nitroreductase family)
MKASGGAGSSPPRRPGGILRILLAAPSLLYRVGLGRLLGHRFLLLVHVGRKSGQVHATPLEVVRWTPGDREAVVVAGWGIRTQWLHNVEAGLAKEVRIGGDRYVPVVRRLDLVEADEVLRTYENHNGLPKQIVRAVIGRLLGWRYDGSPAARRRAVEQLPMLGLRPAP